MKIEKRFEFMRKWVVLIVLFIAFALFIIGDGNNEPLEIQNNGGTMCMACIGLE